MKQTGTFETFRFERKYVVTELTAQAIRRFVAMQMKPDEHTADDPEGYEVNSLYLDTADLQMYRESANGIKNRHKLRIRFYDDWDESPAFLEIKKRTTETIHKLRATVSKAAADRLLAGERLTPADLLSPSDSAVRALTQFCDRVERLQAAGSAYVSYKREAYVSYGVDGERVTFDRHIAGGEYQLGDGLRLPVERSPVAPKGVVLELKYLGQIPAWMYDLISSFELQRISYPKYVYCVDALCAARNMVGSFPRSLAW
jgi:hypothetical protein